MLQQKTAPESAYTAPVPENQPSHAKNPAYVPDLLAVVPYEQESNSKESHTSSPAAPAHHDCSQRKQYPSPTHQVSNATANPSGNDPALTQAAPPACDVASNARSSSSPKHPQLAGKHPSTHLPTK